MDPKSSKEIKSSKTFILKYNRPNVFKFALVDGKRDINLLPKNNFISEEDWNLIKIHPLIEDLFELEEFQGSMSSRLEWVPGFGPEDSPKDAKISSVVNFLETMNDKQATRVVYDTLSPDILKNWYGVEKRPAILKIIGDQIEKLKMPAA